MKIKLLDTLLVILILKVKISLMLKRIKKVLVLKKYIFLKTLETKVMGSILLTI